MFAAALAAIASAGHAQTPAGSQPQAPKPAQIDRNGVLILIRSSLLALDQANKTGNYTVLRDIGAPGFQTNSAARLGEIFAKLRNDNLDLSGVAVIDPQLSLLPQIEANGLMHMAGFFPSVPTQVNFDLSFAPVNGQWRLFGISVSIGQSGPAAPNRPRRPLRKSSPPEWRQAACGGKAAQAPTGTKPPQTPRDQHDPRASERPKMLPDEALKSMKVMFATPCYISAVSMHYVTSIFELTHHCNRFGLRMHPAYAFGKPDHPLAQQDGAASSCPTKP